MLLGIFPWPIFLYICVNIFHGDIVSSFGYHLKKKKGKVRERASEHLNFLRTAHKALSASINFVKLLLLLYLL